MQPKCRSTAFAALSAALFLFASAPAQAQTGLVGVGHGAYQAFNSTDTLHFTFVVQVRCDDSTHGYALWRGPKSIILWKLTSSMFLGDGTLAFAGPIVRTIGTPPAGYEVGRTAFTVVDDDPSGDRIASINVVPKQNGNPNIQQIVQALGIGGGAPPQVFRPLLSGNIWTR